MIFGLGDFFLFASGMGAKFCQIYLCGQILEHHEAGLPPMQPKQKTQGAKIAISNPQIPTHYRGQNSTQQGSFLGIAILAGKHINRQLQPWV